MTLAEKCVLWAPAYKIIVHVSEFTYSYTKTNFKLKKVLIVYFQKINSFFNIFSPIFLPPVYIAK